MSVAPSLDQPTSISRRHDLDALRAIAMLLGIVLHGALSFIEMPAEAWPVQDVRQHEGFSVMMSVVHGFRMPLFFLISGFFTAMLWRKRGLGRLLQHRFRRIFLPLMIGMITIIPVMWIVIIALSVASQPTVESDSASSLVAAARRGDAKALRQHIAAGADVNELAPDRSPPIVLAALAGHAEVVRVLLDNGANVNAQNGDGSSALLVSAFFGHAETAQVLIESGADPTLRNAKDDSPLSVLGAPWGVTAFIAGLVNVEVDEAEVATGRAEVKQMLNKAHPSLAMDAAEQPSVNAAENFGGVLFLLFMFPVFHHLWFLWFLVWLVLAFAIYAKALDLLKWRRFPHWLIVSRWRYAWLLPLTILPQLKMGLMFPNFGPDTSVGLIPMPPILIYYAIFFFFGAMYFDCDDKEGDVGRYWKLTLPIALLVVFPVGYEFTKGGFGFADRLADPQYHRQLSVLLQVVYVWMMTFGLMGMFRSLFSAHSAKLRYISDSSYWLYLAHLPLIMVAQFVVRNWQLPAIVKCGIVCTMVSALLLLTYHWFVRYTAIGTLLNGPRKRPEPEFAPVVLVAD